MRPQKRSLFTKSVSRAGDVPLRLDCRRNKPAGEMSQLCAEADVCEVLLTRALDEEPSIWRCTRGVSQLWRCLSLAVPRACVSASATVRLRV